VPAVAASHLTLAAVAVPCRTVGRGSPASYAATRFNGLFTVYFPHLSRAALYLPRLRSFYTWFCYRARAPGSSYLTYHGSLRGSAPHHHTCSSFCLGLVTPRITLGYLHYAATPFVLPALRTCPACAHCRSPRVSCLGRILCRITRGCFVLPLHFATHPADSSGSRSFCRTPRYLPPLWVHHTTFARPATCACPTWFSVYTPRSSPLRLLLVYRGFPFRGCPLAVLPAAPTCCHIRYARSLEEAFTTATTGCILAYDSGIYSVTCATTIRSNFTFLPDSPTIPFTPSPTTLPLLRVTYDSPFWCLRHTFTSRCHYTHTPSRQRPPSGSHPYLPFCSYASTFQGLSSLSAYSVPTSPSLKHLNTWLRLRATPSSLLLLQQTRRLCFGRRCSFGFIPLHVYRLFACANLDVNNGTRRSRRAR